MTTIVANDWNGRIQPLKADYEVLKKLTMNILNLYFASHNKKPHQDQLPTLMGVIGELYRQKLGVYDSDKVFLFIETPDEMLITIELQDNLVQLGDIKKKYVELLQELHGQVVLPERVRLYRRPNWKSLEHGTRGRALNINKMPRQSLVAVHHEQFQIFVKPLNLKTITLDVSWCTTILELKMMIQDKTTIPIDDQLLTLNSKILSRDNHILSSYTDIRKESTLRLSTRLRGGGKRGHIIKTVVKSKAADKTTSSDSSLFASVFNHSEAVNRTTSVSFTNLLKTMPLNDLKSLYEYLMHDHSRKDMKLQKVPEWCKEIKELIEVQKKVHTALDTMSSLITDNIQESFIDSEGEFSMKELIRAVDNRIAVVTADEAMTDI